MAELKRCPFCGGKAVISVEEYISPRFRRDKNSRYIGPGKDVEWTHGKKIKTYLYAHKECKVQCTTVRCFAKNNNVIFHSEDEAVEAWNRRASNV